MGSFELEDNEPFQAFPKPGQRKKKRNTQKEIGRKLEPPKKLHCRHLGYVTGTECWRHAESRIIKMLDGGGIAGGRINDMLTAWLSDEADKKFSETPPKDAPDYEIQKHALDWALLIIKSHLID